MAFNKSKLKSDILSVFTTMQSDSDFATGLAKSCKDFGESGKVTTTDTGTVSSGVFSGSGSGSLSLDSSLMSSPVLTCCNALRNTQSGGDTLLAQAIGAGILAMTTAGTVETDVTGVTTSPAGSAVPPSSGKAKGKITCSNASLIEGLQNCFTDMKDRAFEEGFDGNDYMAQKIADNVYSYFKNGAITTAGQGALSGTVGSGSIS